VGPIGLLYNYAEPVHADCSQYCKLRLCVGQTTHVFALVKVVALCAELASSSMAMDSDSQKPCRLLTVSSVTERQIVMDILLRS